MGVSFRCRDLHPRSLLVSVLLKREMVTVTVPRVPQAHQSAVFCQQKNFRTEDTGVRGAGSRRARRTPSLSLGFLVCTRRTGASPPGLLCGSAGTAQPGQAWS